MRLSLLPLTCVILSGCSNNPATNSLGAGSTNSINRSSLRSEEEIQLIFQRYSGAIEQLFLRARRENPALKGKVIFEVTIEPSGAVSACDVLLSDMNAEDFLEKIAETIKTINFGANDMPAKTIHYPVEFMPTG